MLLTKKSPHGGNIYESGPFSLCRTDGEPISSFPLLDFSANLNPAGMPEPVKKALLASVEQSAAYPDPYCSSLRECLAKAEGVSKSAVLCGNGAAELIYAFAYAMADPRLSVSFPPEGSVSRRACALVIAPTFSEYASALHAAGVETERFFLSRGEGFRLTEEILQKNLASYRAVFLCSPNNPTGIAVDPDLLWRMAETGARLFCDFCFLDLSDRPDRYRIADLVARFPNVAVLRAFTKSYAMAGVRLGYLLSSDAVLLEGMAEKTQCWNVSVPAQMAGVAALSCREWLSDSVKAIARERARLTEAFFAMGLEVIPSEANFLLLYHERPVILPLLRCGIQVRDCGKEPGLGEGYFRVAVRSPAENDRLLSAMAAVLAKEGDDAEPLCSV